MRWTTVFLTLLLAAVCHAENLAPNPGAEAEADGKLPGFARYLGAGDVQVMASTTEKRTGRSSVCLDVRGWWHRPNTPDTPQNRSVNAALVFAENDGFRAKGALRGEPGDLYAVSFWHKGDLPAATVRVVAWPASDAGSAQRVILADMRDSLTPGDAWRPFGATFRLPDGAPWFAVQILAAGHEGRGYGLGKIYVDDIRITTKALPDGELRAVWWYGPKQKRDREQCLAEAGAMLDWLKAAGFNTIMLTVHSLYLAALERPELAAKAPGADWDSWGNVLKLADDRGLQVHAWYPPWTYKRAHSSVERVDHPQWMSVYIGVRPSDSTVCFVNAQSRQFQLDLLRGLLERYPRLAGLHIEEPGHPICHCDYCAKLAKHWLGLDIRADPAAAGAPLRNLAAFMNGDFFARLRQTVNASRPDLWLSANGSGGANPDWNIARDWPTWSRRGYIDFYVPQIYTEDVTRFTALGRQTLDTLDGGDMVTGMAASWTGIYPRRQDPQNLVDQIRSARRLGAKGFCVFRAALFEKPHWDAFTN